jgi:hypothetical protein
VSKKLSYSVGSMFLELSAMSPDVLIISSADDQDAKATPENLVSISHYKMI